jgi:hypothetical protein
LDFSQLGSSTSELLADADADPPRKLSPIAFGMGIAVAPESELFEF